MKLVLVHNLKPGMTVGKDIFIGDSLLLYPSGAILNDKSITILMLHSIRSIYVKGEPEEQKASKPRRLPPKENKDFKQFSKAFKQTTQLLEDQINDVVTKNTTFRPNDLLSMTKNLFTPGMTTLSLFDMLHHMCSYDDSTYVHSINVALICNVFGRWLNYTQEDIDILTLCGLLHDIGKLNIPETIVKKPGKLTRQEYEIIKCHPYKGYELLRLHKELDPRIAQAALMHHERCDGSGYPMGVRQGRIPTVALIVAIADVYDAMTSKRSYRDPLSPFKAIQIMEDEGIQKYDTYFFLTFLEQILNTYINTDVMLSDNRKAHVIFINKKNLSRPIVTIDNEVLDLSKHREIEIKAII